MIEFNLLPGKKGQYFPGRLRLMQAGRKAVGVRGPYVLLTAAAASFLLGYVGCTLAAVRSEAEELATRLEKAVRDSVHLAGLFKQNRSAAAQRDSIARRVAIIQEIDAGRLAWPHILDEAARALPSYAWLRRISFEGKNPLGVRIAGGAANIPAITTYMRNLESSHFFQAVSPESMVQAPSEKEHDEFIYAFELAAVYVSPPLDEIETVPLFDYEAPVAASALLPER